MGKTTNKQENQKDLQNSKPKKSLPKSLTKAKGQAKTLPNPQFLVSFLYRAVHVN